MRGETKMFKSINEIDKANPNISPKDIEIMFADEISKAFEEFRDGSPQMPVEYEKLEIHINSYHAGYVEIYARDVEAQKAYVAYCGKDASSLPDDFEFGDWASVDETAIVADSAWVYGDAKIREGAEVSGDATICGYAVIKDAARVSGRARVCNYAVVGDNALVCDEALVCDFAKVGGHAKICGHAKVHGHAGVRDEAEVSGNTEAYGRAQVSGKARVTDGKWGEWGNIWGEDVALNQDRIYDALLWKNPVPPASAPPEQPQAVKRRGR
jgi:carbonic anhydrase/acetyltransferase-like protein (isoleucine patch superfamily)